MSKLRVEGKQGWKWSHFLVSCKAVLAPVHSMTGTPKEISDWLQLETFKPLTDEGQKHLLWMLKGGNIHPEPSPVIRSDGAIVGYRMALPEARDGPRFVVVGLKQDEKDGEMDFMTASINYKSWKDFLEAAKYSSFSGTAVAQCEKRMWTSEINSNLENLHERVEKLKNSNPALGARLNFHLLRSFLPDLLRCQLNKDHWQLRAVVRGCLPQTAIDAVPKKLTHLCAELTICDRDEMFRQLRRLRFVGGAQQAWVRSKCLGVAYFVWDSSSPVTFFWYRKSGEEGWIREVRRMNHQSEQYEYAVQNFKTIKVDEPIPLTFEGSNESLFLSQILLNEDAFGKVRPWLLPPISDNEAEIESTADVSESDSSDTKGSKRRRLL